MLSMFCCASDDSSDFKNKQTNASPLEKKIEKLSNFLARVDATVKWLGKEGSQGKDKVRVVMGNESADLDSMVSAIVFAYAATTDTQQLHIPVFNLDREDISLRKEAVMLFEEQKLDVSGVPCYNELPLEELCQQERLTLTLVDHNELTPLQAHLAPCVVSIIDHHRDEEKYPSANKKIVGVGSASTLVTEYAREVSQKLITTQIASLVLACILLDTGNLDASCKVFLPNDVEMAGYLVTVSGKKPEPFFMELMEKRNDMSGLSVRQLLRKDAKMARVGGNTITISTVAGLSFEEWVGLHPTWPAQTMDFITSSDINALVVMFAYSQDSQFNRQLLICSHDQTTFQNIRDGLEGAEARAPLLQLQLLDHRSTPASCPSTPPPMLMGGDSGGGGGALSWVAYDQQNVKASRKKVMPLMVQVMGSLPVSAPEASL